MKLAASPNKYEQFEESKEVQNMTQSYEALQQNEESTSPEGTADYQPTNKVKLGSNGSSMQEKAIGMNGNGHYTNGAAKPIRVSSDDSDDLFPFGDGALKKSIANSYKRIGVKNGSKQPVVARPKTARLVTANGGNGFHSISNNSPIEQLLDGEARPWNIANSVVPELKSAPQESIHKNGSITNPIAEPEVSKPRDSKLKGLVFTSEPSVDSLHQENVPSAPTSPYRSVWLEIPEGSPVFPFDGSAPRVAEQYRILRTSILLNPAKPHVVAVSSGSSGDGKTLTAINIAGILAMKSETTVLIVEGDLRKCALAPILGIKSFPGLAEVLNGTTSLDNAIIRAEQLPNFHVLPAGNVTDNPAELLDSDEFRKFVKDARERFSFVVFDTTPAASVADFKLVMQVSDGVLMVVRPDHTDRDSFQRAFELVPEKLLLGAVINAFEDWFLWKKLDANYYYSGEVRKAKAKPFFNWRRRSSAK